MALYTFVAGEEVTSAQLNDSFASKVATTGDETIEGIKTFDSFPLTPSAAPTADYQTANKKYVNDSNPVFYGAISGMTIPEASPVFVATDNATEVTQLKWFNGANPTGGSVELENINDKISQSFVIEGTGTIDVTAIRIKITTNNSPGNWKVSIQTDSAGSPSGSIIEDTGTLTSADIGGASVEPWAHLAFTSPATLTRGTTYWLVLESLELEDASNYYLVNTQSPSVFGTFKVRPYGGAWGSVANTLLFEVYSNTIIGRVYRTDARETDKVKSYLGFNIADVEGNDTVSIRYMGIYAGLTGKSVSQVYYLGDNTYDNEGWVDINTSAGVVNKIAGRTILSTQIFIKSNNE